MSSSVMREQQQYTHSFFGRHNFLLSHSQIKLKLRWDKKERKKKMTKNLIINIFEIRIGYVRSHEKVDESPNHKIQGVLHSCSYGNCREVHLMWSGTTNSEMEIHSWNEICQLCIVHMVWEGSNTREHDRVKSVPVFLYQTVCNLCWTDCLTTHDLYHQIRILYEQYNHKHSRIPVQYCTEFAKGCWHISTYGNQILPWWDKRLSLLPPDSPLGC